MFRDRFRDVSRPFSKTLNLNISETLSKKKDNNLIFRLMALLHYN